MLLILLVAAGLRLYNLAGTPPGMTHDEADHGLTAWSIVNGARDIYFTIGYGREPLYDYATALLMAGTGPTIFAARLTSVYFSLLLIAGMFSWTRRAFGSQVALLTAAGLAVGFWPVMAGRQALRSITLPALFVLAVLFFWQGLEALPRPGNKKADRGMSPLWGSALIHLVIAGIFLGLSVYTYIPARIMWLAFPLLIGYRWLADRFANKDRAYSPNAYLFALLVPLVVAAIVALPLILYLTTNPGLEVRIDELSAPLRAAAAGDFGPLGANAIRSLGLFTFQGDTTWRYNIPGKPFLGTLMGLLFYGGILLGLWLVVLGLKKRAFQLRFGFSTAGSSGAFLALTWLVLGFAPVLVTGPALSMTQAIGAMPVIYLFPALALVAGFRSAFSFFRGYNPNNASRSTAHKDQWTAIGIITAVILFSAIGLLTIRDYFGRWTNHPEVRIQYETSMITALNYLTQNKVGAAAVSTITPGRYHTPAVAQLTLRNENQTTRWFDGRQSLLLPGDPQSLVVIPGFTPLPQSLTTYLPELKLVEEIPMRPNDLDRPIRIYSVDGPAATATILAHLTTQSLSGLLPARFSNQLDLLGYDLSTSTARAGDTITLVTAWRLGQEMPGVNLFAHLIGDGQLLAQADRLGAPGESWIAGDTLLQVHEIAVPADIKPGEYQIAVGAYKQPTGQRLRLENGDDILPLSMITIIHD